MRSRVTLALVVALAVAATGCDYIVPPFDDSTPTPAVPSEGWGGVVTNVTDANGSLHVDLSIVNKTGDWSAMDVAASTAKVTDTSGKSTTCATVFVGTSKFSNGSGWFLAAGFVMKGYTTGTVTEPKTQLLYVECAGVTKAQAAKVAVSYSYVYGAFNYYVPSTVFKDTLNLDLSKVVSDTKYPIAQSLPSLKIAKVGDAITGINACTVTLKTVTRTDTGLELDWESANPSKYPAYVHIGIPPVIGVDGILYGPYQSPHLADAPITLAGQSATWSTTVAVPASATGLYVLTPVETQQQKYFVDHVVDITDK